MTQTIHSHTFDNGLVLVAETMDWLQSAAMAMLLPAGYIYDPRSRLGLSNFACEMVQRGCGPRDSRQFVEDLDRLGVDRSASVSSAHTTFGGATIASNLPATIGIFADLIRRPHLPTQQLEEARQVCFQEIWSAEDDVAQKTILKLKERHYGDPWGRPAQGAFASVEQISAEEVQRFVSEYYRPRGAIITVAGNVQWDRLRDCVEEHFGDWPIASSSPFEESLPQGGYEHIPFDSSQTQIGIAYRNVPYSDPRYFQARGAVGILSDGMSSRLFTEVRELRGLCYSVYASCHSLRDRGAVLTYAGTSTERAQETLEVVLSELTRLRLGVEQDELNRLQARIKSNLIMQQESSASRAVAMAADWFHLGRVLTMEELGNIIDNLSCASINAFLKGHAPEKFTIVTLGEKELEVPSEIP